MSALAPLTGAERTFVRQAQVDAVAPSNALAYRANGAQAHAEADLEEAVRLKSSNAKP